MLDFPQEFFLEEIREDFKVDSTMKAFWAATMEVLREIAEVCERHNLQWYAAYGTLLGAIRHEGFVPWDDDLDIWMKREDYNKFMEVAPEELPKGFVVESPLTEKGYTQFHSCVFNSFNISVAEERLRKYHGCPFAVGVDIFPLDYLPKDEEEREGQHAIYTLIGVTVALIKKEERTEEDEQDLQDAFDTLEDVCNITFQREQVYTDQKDELLSDIYKLANQLCMCYGDADGDELVMYMDYANWPHKVYKKEWFDEAEQRPFEGFLLPVPSQPEEILKIIYGDYNIRVCSGTRHDYPLYNKQLKFLREITEGLEEKAARIDELIAQAKKEHLQRHEQQ